VKEATTLMHCTTVHSGVRNSIMTIWRDVRNRFHFTKLLFLFINWTGSGHVAVQIVCPLLSSLLVLVIGRRYMATGARLHLVLSIIFYT
jgi:hypothetical protein